MEKKLTIEEALMLKSQKNDGLIGFIKDAGAFILFSPTCLDSILIPKQIIDSAEIVENWPCIVSTFPPKVTLKRAFKIILNDENDLISNLTQNESSLKEVVRAYYQIVKKQDFQPFDISDIEC